MRIAHRQELDDQRLALFDVNACLFARRHPVKEDGRRQHAGVGVEALVFGELGKDTRIEQMRHHFTIIDRALDLLFELLPGTGEVGRWQ